MLAVVIVAGSTVVIVAARRRRQCERRVMLVADSGGVTVWHVGNKLGMSKIQLIMLSQSYYHICY